MRPRNFLLLPCLSVMLLLSPPLHAGRPPCDPRPFFFGAALDGYPITTERVKGTADEMGSPPELVVFFLQWPSIEGQDSAPFPEGSLDAIWNTGAIPCLTWEPMYYSEGREVMVPHQDLLSGAYDPYLMGFAKRAAAWKRPFMIRLAHEMNIARYHWGTEPSAYGPESPRIYRQMFQYVVTLFQKAGARNVVWVFCPNSESVPNASYDSSASWNRIEAYYPGDSYVDVLGMDGYNWGTTQKRAINGWDSRWRDFTDIFRPAWETLSRMAPEKPIFVFETASVEQGGDKRLWTRNALETARNWGLSGFVWFQVKKEYDWRINSGGDAPRGNFEGPEGCSPHTWLRRLSK